MDVRIKRVDKSFPLPEYKTAGAVAFDLYLREDVTIEAADFAMSPTNLIIDIPEGYALVIAARSSSAKKKGLNMRNGIGIIDQDYCGEQDEIHILIQNLTDKDISIPAGERVAQAMFVRVDTARFIEVEKMADTNRGGFGSTG